VLLRPIVRQVALENPWRVVNIWSLTDTLTAQAVNPSTTLTAPRASSPPLNTREIRRSCRVADAVTVKSEALVVEPALVVTVILPDVAPAGTVVVTCVSEFTAKAAGTPLNSTLVVADRFLPVIVIEAPVDPDVGFNDCTEGIPVDGGGGAPPPRLQLWFALMQSATS